MSRNCKRLSTDPERQGNGIAVTALKASKFQVYGMSPLRLIRKPFLFESDFTCGLSGYVFWLNMVISFHQIIYAYTFPLKLTLLQLFIHIRHTNAWVLLSFRKIFDLSSIIFVVCIADTPTCEFTRQALLHLQNGQNKIRSYNEK